MLLLLHTAVLQAVVERCGHKLPPVHSLITLGGQHQGVANTPGQGHQQAAGEAAAAATVTARPEGHRASVPTVVL